MRSNKLVNLMMIPKSQMPVEADVVEVRMRLAATA